MDGWKTILSFWGPPYFKGRLLLVLGTLGRLYISHEISCTESKPSSAPWGLKSFGGSSLGWQRNKDNLFLLQITRGGGFKDFLFSPLPEEMIQFDEHIFQMG